MEVSSVHQYVRDRRVSLGPSLQLSHGCRHFGVFQCLPQTWNLTFLKLKKRIPKKYRIRLRAKRNQYHKLSWRKYICLLIAYNLSALEVLGNLWVVCGWKALWNQRNKAEEGGDLTLAGLKVKGSGNFKLQAWFQDMGWLLEETELWLLVSLSLCWLSVTVGFPVPPLGARGTNGGVFHVATQWGISAAPSLLASRPPLPFWCCLHWQGLSTGFSSVLM